MIATSAACSNSFTAPRLAASGAPDLSAWLAEDLNRLVTLSDLPHDAPTLAALARAAHDVRGLARTYGFPVLARLCATVEALARNAASEIMSRPARPLRNELIRLHALACLACVREGYTGERAKPLLSALLVGLENARIAVD